MKQIWRLKSLIRVIGRRHFSDASVVPLRATKSKSKLATSRVFIDEKRVRAIGGSGGDGCISLLQVWSNDKAGPDGGDGGNGGHVIIQATCNVRDLNHIPTVMKGRNGEKGYNKDCHGKSADHYILKVPIGTVIKNSNQEVIGDLNKEGIMFVLARGGAGGHGNHYFISDTEQCPIVAEVGAKGEDLAYVLEVKSLANFGLVGLPNAGKSTLLQAISRARPKVAAYPFTTLKPHLGMVQYSDFEQIAVADLPGLVEGSHVNKGLGSEFLKHVERCTCLLMVVDLSGNPKEDLVVLRNEIACYDSSLASRAQLIVGNKLDIPGSEAALESLRSSEGQDCVVGVSAKFGTNVTQLLLRLKVIYDKNSTNATAESNSS